MERRLVFCRCEPESKEVEDTPWVPNCCGALEELARRSVEVGLALGRRRSSTAVVLLCRTMRMLGSDRICLWVFFCAAAERDCGGGGLRRSFRKVPILRSSHRKARVMALLLSCSVTSTRSIALCFNQASGLGRSRRTHAERYENRFTSQIRTPETMESEIVP